MTVFEIVIQSILILGFAVILYFLIRYPHHIIRFLFVESSLRFRFLTFPIWAPIWVLDKVFKWKLWEVPKFEEPSEELPDIEYEAEAELPIAFEDFTKVLFLHSSNVDFVADQLREAVSTLDNLEEDHFQIASRDRLIITTYKGNSLYSFAYVVQWMDSLAKIESYGYAYSKDIQFFIIRDPDTLNNLIGETDSGLRFALSLYENLDEECKLTLNQSIKINKKISTNNFQKMLGEHAV